MEKPRPSLTAFERHVAARDHAGAVREALRILGSIDDALGRIDGIDWGATAPEAGAKELHIRFATRFVAAYGDLLTQADVTIGSIAVDLLFTYHRWTDMMFALSGFQTSAHLLDRLTGADKGQWTLAGSALVRFLIIFSPSSILEIDLDEMYAANPVATLIAAIGYISTLTCFTPRACAFRERLLAWLPGRLNDFTLARVSVHSMTGAYMHCSYAALPDKHRVKADIIAQIRKVALTAGAREMHELPPKRTRPRIVVVAEHFRAGHSVYRTHSRAVRALRARFEVIGVAYENLIDDYTRELFDDVITFPRVDVYDSARHVADEILTRAPDIVFYLGVGMLSHAIALASLRLAPIQCASYGHTATTMSPVMDYMILPDDFVGEESCFSERILRMPAEAIPYAPPLPGEGAAPPRTPLAKVERDILRIAVPGAVMKINAPFLAALSRISARASRPVEFAFFPVAAKGMSHFYLEQEVLRVLPNATVYPETARALYLQRLGACAFSLSPFPYGNMNSIIDAVLMGVPGVCLDGAEAHAHADAAIFRRLGLPEDLITSSEDAYVEAAVRLVDDAGWRAECRRIASDVDLGETFYKGDERLFCDAMYALLARGA